MSKTTNDAPFAEFLPRRTRKDRDAVVAGVVFTLLAHLGVFYAIPHFALFPAAEAARQNPPLELLLVTEWEEEREERYVRAAPDREQLRPEETINISDRDQQAAQEQMAPLSPDNSPLVRGDEPDSTRIVQGNPFQDRSPTPSFGGGQETGDSAMVQREAAPRERGSANPLDAPEGETADDPDGTLMVEERGDARQTAPEELPDSIAQALQDQESPFDGQGRDRIQTPAQQSADDRAVPRPRVRVERDTSYGPLRDSATGANRIGRLAFDAEYSEFGEYWRRVAEIIERRWRNILFNTRSVAFSGARVTVEFQITREGQVRDARVTHSDAGRMAETISLDAIASEAPFFRWTPDMILRMGDEAAFRITFIY
jgi:hypothetical protein